jgi:hypothetical protein
VLSYGKTNPPEGFVTGTYSVIKLTFISSHIASNIVNIIFKYPIALIYVQTGSGVHPAFYPMGTGGKAVGA